ncbi:HNH endonuclease [Thalassotalea profundi]|uniref:Uncharacterized protein n=1 Tax=Thalassotalea profundi TaxID=2036687 RepID=A0ABQ3IDC5_9GAMM|nr:HNH endonuclease [Thalassotalea profundi]GHE80212.1 hypothetical protein GCM10011501_05060 [Thalassotalea profundi]
METLLLFLANALASGGIGHYVGKGLSRIDKSLPNLLNNNSDIEGACRIISERNLEMEVLKLSDEIKNKLNSTDTENILSFNGTNNQGIIANVVNLKNLNNKVNISPPLGSISSSLSHKNYIKYLIDRYHEFKKAEVGKNNLKYPVFYGSIKKEFGAKWDMISLTNFSELSEFIQKRINKTILGKNRKAQNKSNYSSYTDYIAKHGS